MKVLIAYASKHGSTGEIAERVGRSLRTAGHEVLVLPVSAAADPAAFEAVAVGSAVYMGHWMKGATRFIRLHHADLAKRPLWLFSSGPVGSKSLPEAVEVASFRRSLQVREHRTFSGVLVPSKLSLAERLMVKAVTAPYGDDRSWEDIDSWARGIADCLLAAPA